MNEATERCRCGHARFLHKGKLCWGGTRCNCVAFTSALLADVRLPASQQAGAAEPLPEREG